MKYFNLFSNIIITFGVDRILISDLQRNTSELFPYELGILLNELASTSIEDVSKRYNSESKEILKDYISLLLGEEYGFITHNDWDRNFPPLSLRFDDASAVSNIFVTIKEVSSLIKIHKSIENLQIKHLAIYIDRALNLQEFVSIDNIFFTSTLQGIEIYSAFDDEVNAQFISTLHRKTARIYTLNFYNCKETPCDLEENYRFELNFINRKINLNSCGKVNLDYFNTNQPKVLEAINYNSCLHKKIAIDFEGNIKNCPAMPQSFGNIEDTTLEEALHHKDFKRYWNLTKDNIEVCKDCEFRYICTDCRAYTERTHKNADGLDTSKPLKCGYNPYTGKWQEWSTNPLKEKAIKFYGMEDLVKE